MEEGDKQIYYLKLNHRYDGVSSKWNQPKWLCRLLKFNAKNELQPPTNLDTNHLIERLILRDVSRIF